MAVFTDTSLSAGMADPLTRWRPDRAVGGGDPTGVPPAMSEPQDAASESLRQASQLAGEVVALVLQAAERRLQVGELALQRGLAQ